jgi:hypothetical protein
MRLCGEKGCLWTDTHYQDLKIPVMQSVGGNRNPTCCREFLPSYALPYTGRGSCALQGKPGIHVTDRPRIYPMRDNGIPLLASKQGRQSAKMVKIIVRQKGNRRWNLPYEFPLMDSQGILVMRDRRRLPDRRKAAYDLDDLEIILSRMLTGHDD